MPPAKHTPGPWEAVNDAIVALDSDVNIADVRLCDGINPNEWQANLHLIAAAPDLLDIARMIVHICESGDNNLASLACMETSPLVDAAREAIAKAEGR